MAHLPSRCEWGLSYASLQVGQKTLPGISGRVKNPLVLAQLFLGVILKDLGSVTVCERFSTMFSQALSMGLVIIPVTVLYSSSGCTGFVC